MFHLFPKEKYQSVVSIKRKRLSIICAYTQHFMKPTVSLSPFHPLSIVFTISTSDNVYSEQTATSSASLHYSFLSEAVQFHI